MSAMHDYYRGTGAGIGADEVGDDVVETKLDSPVVLGQLVGFALDVPWTPDLVQGDLVWPEDPAEMGSRWVERLSDHTRDTLAGIPDDRIAELAARWIRVEELGGDDNDEPPYALVGVLTELIGLARRAVAADEHLYCRVTL